MGARLGKGLLTLLLVLGLLAPGAMISGQEPAHMVETTAATSEPLMDGTFTEDACQVTLISGDVVTVVTGADGDRRFAVSPADAMDAGQPFYVVKEPGSTYVIPVGVDLQKLDKELFNIEYLTVEAYHQQPSLPLLVTYLPALAEPKVEVLAGVISALGHETRLHREVYTLSTRIPYDDISASYDSLVSRPEVRKIWLDKKVYVQLSDSVPLIGAEWWWTNTGNTGDGVSIAILDTGIDASHPAFEDRVKVNINFSDDPTPDDWHGHGTHCAGIAAGSAAGTDYQGVAPGADLWNVKVINQHGWGFQSWIIDGIDFASLGPDGQPGTGDEADVISMSLGGWPTDGTDPLSQAVNLAVERGVIVVAAAGNDGPSRLTIATPGAAEKAITVGAADKLDTVAWFSSRGPTLDWRVKPDVVAPGVDITSAVPWGYESWSGTSMATPHVAGAAALLLEQYGGEATPQFIKDALIYTARDLGHSIYEQGGGRLDLDWELWPTIGVTPANLSLGLATEATVGSNLTFFTTAPTAQEVTLAAILTDSLMGDDYSAAVTLAPSSFTIPTAGEVEVTLDVDLTGLPHSVFEGKVIATVEEGEGRPVHAIFGFAHLTEVTVHKVDIHGEPARWHPLWVLRESPYEGIMFEWGEFDEFGNFTFRAPLGTYQFISPNWWHEEEEVTIWTIAENVDVSGNTTVVLDERETLLVDFDPQKPGQVAAAKSATLLLREDHYYSHAWRASWWYPADFCTRVSPISRFDASFVYNYYAEADFLLDRPWLVNTDEWHNLRYSVTGISSATTFAADYPNLVQRQTHYCVALEDELAEWAQFSWDDVCPWPSAFGYDMSAPQTRLEWLSPYPVRYGQYYARAAEPWGEWYFEGWDMRYPPGEHEWRIGAHPLTPGIETWIWGNWLQIGGLITRDAAGNDFANLQAWHSGSITIIKDGMEVLHDSIWDSFWTGVEFEGTPHFLVEIEGWRPLALSSTTRTVLDFVADPAHDYRPPRLLAFEVPGLDIFGAMPNGEVTVKVRVMDESPLYDVSLAYSVDDGEMWSDAGSPVLEAGWLVFSLGEIHDSFVDLVVEAQDLHGNRIHHSVQQAFRVGPWLLIRTVELPAGQVEVAYEATLKAIGGTKPYTWDIVDGALPTGLNLATETGVLSGIPTTVGNFEFTVQATDAADLSATQELSINVFAWTQFITDPEGDQFEGHGPDIVGVDLHLDDETIYFRVRTAEPIDCYDIVNYMFLDLDLNASTGFVSPYPEIPTNDIGADAAAVIFAGYYYGMMEEELSLPMGRARDERRFETQQAQASGVDLWGELWLWDSDYEWFDYVADFSVSMDTDHFWFAIHLDMLDDDGIMAVVGLIGDYHWGFTDVAPNEGHGVTIDSGIEGLVTDAVTEEPLEGASISVPETGQLRHSDESGHYRLYLAQGTYNVTASAFGYYEQSALLDVEEDAFTSQSFALEPMPRGFISGTVTDRETDAPIEGAIITLLDTPLSTTTNEFGYYVIEAPIGTSDVSAWARGYWASIAHDVDVIAGETVSVDFALEPALASVAVLGDYDYQLTGLLMANDIWAEERGWDVIDNMADYDAVVVNRPYDPGKDTFLEFLEAASDNEVGVVFTSSWPVEWEPYGISLLQWYLGDPIAQDHSYADGDVYYKVTEEHPIFDGWDAGDEIDIITGGWQAHAWFWGYSGYTMGEVGSEYGGIRGDAVALSAYGSSLHVLLAGLAPQWNTNVNDWTEDAGTIFVNAILTASGLIDLDLVVVTSELPPAVLDEEYEATINAMGGTKPYTWDIIDGALPPGLGFDPDTGVISGTPIQAGTFDFTVAVTDAAQATATRELSITVLFWTEFITDPVGDQFDGHGPDLVGIDFHLDGSAIRFRVRTAEPIDLHDVVNLMLLDLDLDTSTGFVSDDPAMPTNDIGADAIALVVPAYLVMAEESSSPALMTTYARQLEAEPAQASSSGLWGGVFLWNPDLGDFSFVGYLVVFADTHSLSFAIPLDMLDDDGVMAVVNLTGCVIAGDFEPTDVAPNEGHGVTMPPANAVRILPGVVLPGEEFEVTVTFTSPADNFNAIGLSDVAPGGWAVAVDTAWTTPTAMVAATPVPDRAAYIWGGPYAAGVEFIAVYRVQVPPGATPGTCTFPGGTLEYYVGGTGSYVEPITGDYEVAVATARIEGQARAVDCAILAGATVTLYQNGALITSTVSDGDGNYVLAVPGLGEYMVAASKNGFRDEERAVTVTEPTTHTIDFLGDGGLIPDSPGMSYVLACINLWQFGEPPCRLTMSGVLAVINAWQYPV